MCNRYASPRPEDVCQRWQPRQVSVNFPPGPLFPRAIGPLIRAASDGAAPSRELVVGQWALIPWFAKAPKLPYSTNNARFEGVTTAASYKHPWCARPALHHPGGVVRRALLGVRQERMVALSPRRW
jgi:putative SOS response-associated peptidase YedK